MDLAIQLASGDETNEQTVKDLKDQKSQLLLRQTRRGEHLVALLAAIKEEFKLLRVEFLEMNKEKKVMKIIGDFQILTKIGFLKWKKNSSEKHKKAAVTT